jgi:hypothetical protein
MDHAREQHLVDRLPKPKIPYLVLLGNGSKELDFFLSQRSVRNHISALDRDGLSRLCFRRPGHPHATLENQGDQDKQQRTETLSHRESSL